MAWHICRYWQCVENYGGQCYGGGCRMNPMPERDDDNDNETEKIQEEN